MHRRDEHGSSVVSVTLGVLVFFVMLFSAAQLLFVMHLSSVVNATAYDTARIVARSGSSSDASARAAAAVHAHALLDGTNDLNVDFSASTPESVIVTISATPPTFVGTSFGLGLLTEVSRTVSVRVEQPVGLAP